MIFYKNNATLWILKTTLTKKKKWVRFYFLHFCGQSQLNCSWRDLPRPEWAHPSTVSRPNAYYPLQPLVVRSSWAARLPGNRRCAVLRWGPGRAGSRAGDRAGCRAGERRCEAGSGVSKGSLRAGKTPRAEGRIVSASVSAWCFARSDGKKLGRDVQLLSDSAGGRGGGGNWQDCLLGSYKPFLPLRNSASLII